MNVESVLGSARVRARACRSVGIHMHTFDVSICLLLAEFLQNRYCLVLSQLIYHNKICVRRHSHLCIFFTYAATTIPDCKVPVTIATPTPQLPFPHRIVSSAKQSFTLSTTDRPLWVDKVGRDEWSAYRLLDRCYAVANIEARFCVYVSCGARLNISV